MDQFPNFLLKTYINWNVLSLDLLKFSISCVYNDEEHYCSFHHHLIVIGLNNWFIVLKI